MLTTIELKNYIYEKFQQILDDSTSQQKIKPHVRFCVGMADSVEGTYVYTSDKTYHYLFTEKGKVKFDKVSFDLNEITYWVFEMEIFTIAMEYATRNRLEGKDFRKQLFIKELELHSKLGEYFYNKKRIQIEEILKENPYIKIK
jgi:hypothetical protein